MTKRYSTPNLKTFTGPTGLGEHMSNFERMMKRANASAQADAKIAHMETTIQGLLQAHNRQLVIMAVYEAEFGDANMELVSKVDAVMKGQTFKSMEDMFTAIRGVAKTEWAEMQFEAASKAFDEANPQFEGRPSIEESLALGRALLGQPEASDRTSPEGSDTPDAEQK